MSVDLHVAIAGLIVGFTVGLTGMGGGALMTPILVLLFKIQPLAAVSSDLVAAFIMKPVGAAVHFRRGTVNRALVGWLSAGSVPAAFAGVLTLRRLGDSEAVQQRLKWALGAALLLAVGTMIAKAFLEVRARAARKLAVAAPSAARPRTDVRIRPLPKAAIGALGGLVVGMTSVGSGSLIIVLLLLVYPSLKASELVGTDLVQAIPLVGAAALGHLAFGDFELGLTTSLLVGALPGVYLGARVSAQAPSGLIRRSLAVILAASGLKLLGMETGALGVFLVVAVAAGPLAWRYVRATGGFHPGSRLAAQQIG
jgi:uncharacterized protein